MNEKTDLFDPAGKALRYEIVEVDPNTVKVSEYNPRYDVFHEGREFDALKASIAAHGQTSDAVGVRDQDGTIQLITGSRRRQACAELGQTLSVKIVVVGGQQAFKFALADEDGREAVSLWDQARSYRRVLDKGTFKSDTELAKKMGIDKSTLSRAFALLDAPLAVLALMDPRQITASKWNVLAPLLNDQATRDLILAEADLLAAAPPSTPAAMSALIAAANGEEPFEPIPVTIAAGKRQGTVTRTPAGGWTVRIKPLREPTKQLEGQLGKAVVDALAKAWREDRERQVEQAKGEAAATE